MVNEAFSTSVLPSCSRVMFCTCRCLWWKILLLILYFTNFLSCLVILILL